MVNQNLACLQCKENNLLYRDESGFLYCKECYWKLEKNKYSKPKGDLFTDSDVYRSCPFCGLGDLCDTSGCVKQCEWCKIIDREKAYDKPYCSLECKNLAEEEENKKRDLENSKWCSFCSQPACNTQRNDYPNKYFCRDCFLKKKPEIKLPDKRTLRKRKRNLRNDWSCPHYEAEFNDQLIADVREAEKERIIKSYWLPEWKPVMKNKEGKNICADCYHDGEEFLLLVQELTTSKFAGICLKLSNSRNDYEKMKNCSLNNIEEFEEAKEKVRKEVVSINEEVDLDKSNQIKSNQIKSNQIKSNQIKSNQIKSTLQTFHSNSISSVELADQGDLVITYQNKPTATLKPTDLTTNPNLQNLKNSMKKNNQTKLTKEELEQKLRELEEQRKKLEGEEQKPKDSDLGWKIGIGVLVGVSLVGLVVVILVKARKKQ